MAAYLKNNGTDGRWIEWHVGEPIPKIVLTWQVVTIQADGHELEAILDALKQTFKSTKGQGNDSALIGQPSQDHPGVL